MKFTHTPVLLQEVLQYLNPQPNEDCIDCTIGGGGHAREILGKTSPKGKLLGFDLDENAINAAQENLADFGARAILINDNYINIKQTAYDRGFNQVNCILLDLGLSSFELEDQRRGFSFKGSDLLDMRFGSEGKTASDVLNKYKEEELARIFKEYGEERFAKSIAKEIVKARKQQLLKTTDELVNIIENVYRNKPKPKIHVATKVFQALRIEVNDELENIKKVLPDALELLADGGRLAVISFHSLEDRIIKEYFKKEAKDCLCPPEVPLCACGHKAQLKILTKKPISASIQEIRTNPRSRSAKLRAAIKITN